MRLLKLVNRKTPCDLCFSNLIVIDTKLVSYPYFKNTQIVHTEYCARCGCVLWSTCKPFKEEDQLNDHSLLSFDR